MDDETINITKMKTWTLILHPKESRPLHIGGFTRKHWESMELWNITKPD